MARMVYVCQECGHKESKWMGFCSHCQTWNSFIESTQDSKAIKKKSKSKQILSKPLTISRINQSTHQRIKTGILEFDRVLGGGIVAGSLCLIGGEPGIGKSTLLSQIASKLIDQKVIYISGEESQSQIASRFLRLGINKKNILILHESNWHHIEKHLEKIQPSVIILDSIQTTISHNISSMAGSSAQVKEITFELMNYCKSNQTVGFVIGHVTKDGGIAGPKVLEHMVDIVISFEGDKDNHHRTLRALKNRFGSTNEIGIFKMTDRGLCQIDNPSLFFTREQNNTSALGRGMSCLLEGRRALMVEAQALAIDSQFGSPARTTQGYDHKRLALLVAIIEKHLNLPMGRCDIYINIVGGLKISSRESDLAIISSLLSSYYSKPLNTQTVYLGEVDLTGEIRSITNLEDRIKEIYACGYNQIILPESNLKKLKTRFENVSYIGVKKINELIEYIF